MRLVCSVTTSISLSAAAGSGESRSRMSAGVMARSAAPRRMKMPSLDMTTSFDCPTETTPTSLPSTATKSRAISTEPLICLWTASKLRRSRSRSHPTIPRLSSIPTRILPPPLFPNAETTRARAGGWTVPALNSTVSVSPRAAQVRGFRCRALWSPLSNAAINRRAALWHVLVELPC